MRPVPREGEVESEHYQSHTAALIVTVAICLQVIGAFVQTFYSVKASRAFLDSLRPRCRVEEAVIEAAMKWADTQSVTKVSRPEEHNLWVRIRDYSLLHASQEEKPKCAESGFCDKCSEGAQFPVTHPAPTPPVEEAKCEHGGFGSRPVCPECEEAKPWPHDKLCGEWGRPGPCSCSTPKEKP